jgi:protein NRD1
MHKQQPPANPTPAATSAAPINPQTGLNNFLAAQFGGASATPVNQGLPATSAQAVNPLGAMFPCMSNGAANQIQNVANAPPNQNPLAALLGQSQAAGVAGQNGAPAPDAQVQIQLIQALAQNGVPPDQWAAALQILNAQTANGGNGGQPGQWGANGAASRDRDASTRSPLGQGRRRSRSPGFDRRRGASPDRRRGDASGNPNPFRDERRGGGDYRQRSPQGRRRRSPSPQKNEPGLPPPGPRNIQFDRTLPPGHIKVLSRTLFVGGVTQREPQLRDLFAQYGIVQTCIVNIDKRHAFIKMLTREYAQRARTGMEEYRENGSQIRTKWGVGFGPRDCSDYQTGISIIPIDRLTDADRKWMVTAEYGGTGGQAMEAGMVVEEPDIEIGAGVSSKGKNTPPFTYLYRH